MWHPCTYDTFRTMAAAVVRKFHRAPLATPGYGAPINAAAAAAAVADDVNGAAADASAAACMSESADAADDGTYTLCSGRLWCGSTECSLCCWCCCLWCWPYSAAAAEVSDCGSTDCWRSWSRRNWFWRFHFVLYQHTHIRRVRQNTTSYKGRE